MFFFKYIWLFRYTNRKLSYVFGGALPLISLYFTRKFCPCVAMGQDHMHIL